ncbi:MAG: hypothetical protein KF693_14045 [Nitrospira sp.]|nr:hypothetical protein [Nitrospira sp.]
MSLTLLLRCNDLEETRKFYRSALGFDAFGSLEGTLTVEKHGGKLIFTAGDLWESPTSFSGTIYFAVPDVDEYFESVQGTATVAWPIENMPYGSREFGIKDCNGYHLAFQQRT